MKSTIKQLESRGYVGETIEKKYSDLSSEDLIVLLKSNIPVERTVAARLLFMNPEIQVIKSLIEALAREKKLYPKIEICNSLVAFGKKSVKPLISLLGKVGNNQYRKIPDTSFKKKNYPLPRDIVARTLIRIGEPALTDLLTCLKSDDLDMLSEAIDAIGYICYYKYHLYVYSALEERFNKGYLNDLIRWKLYRAMSAFPESSGFLVKQSMINRNERLSIEIDRSLKLISSRS
jgi:hypothetical protein